MARPTDDPKTERIDLRFPPRMLSAVDEWRRHQPDIPARAEAIRRLVARGLADGSMVSAVTDMLGIFSKLANRGALTDQDKANVTEILRAVRTARDSTEVDGDGLDFDLRP